MSKWIQKNYLRVPVGMLYDRLGVYILRRTLDRKRFKTRINVKEAAEEIGVCEKTIKNWIRKGSPGKTWFKKKDRVENLFLMNLTTTYPGFGEEAKVAMSDAAVADVKKLEKLAGERGELKGGRREKTATRADLKRKWEKLSPGGKEVVDLVLKRMGKGKKK